MSAGAGFTVSDTYERVPPLRPMVDDIGIAIIEHGERDHLDPEHPEACLCGRYEPYYWCPGEGVESLTLSLDEEGRIHAD